MVIRSKVGVRIQVKPMSSRASYIQAARRQPAGPAHEGPGTENAATLASSARTADLAACPVHFALFGCTTLHREVVRHERDGGRIQAAGPTSGP